MNTNHPENEDAILVGAILNWRPLSEVGRYEMGGLISELREDKEWSRDRCDRAIRAYKTHRRVMRQIMGLSIVSEVAA